MLDLRHIDRERVDLRVDALDARREPVEPRFDALDARREAVEPNFNAIEAPFHPIEPAVDRVESTVHEVEASIDPYETGLRGGFEAKHRVHDVFEFHVVHRLARRDESISRQAIGPGA